MATPKPSAGTDATREEIEAVDRLIEQGRIAMAEIANADQARVDEIVTAIAWSLYKPENAQRLAKMAVQDTGIGNVEDKIIKNQRKTFGTLRDLMRAKTVGITDAGTDATREEIEAVDRLIEQGRIAMAEIANADQARVDEIVTAIAWSLYKPENAQRLAILPLRCYAQPGKIARGWPPLPV